MRIVKAGNSVLFLGAQGENLATQIQFPVAESWAELYGQGLFQLLYKRPGEDEPYACAVGIDGENVTWDITNTEVAIVGNGRCELYYFVDNVLAISAQWVTKCVESLADVGGDPPEPWESWVQEVLAAGAAAQGAAVSAGASAESAEHSAEIASEKAGEAETSAINANISAQAAQDAANSMSFVSFDIDPDGDLYINRSEHLGTTAFELNENGELEVSI